jgi:putative OPT family oligopeptide transporter
VDPLQPKPLDRTMRQLTVRAVATGVVLGAALSLCNIYSGLKIGWSSNMSITATLLAFAFWRAVSAATGAPPFTILENNVNQAAGSAGAAIASAGLVAPIPALTMLEGTVLSWPVLALWTFSVCCVGIVVAVGLRRQMVVVDRLPFPAGIATAEMLTEMHASGREALGKVRALAAAAVVSAGVKVAEHLGALGRLALPLGASTPAGPVSARNLTFALEPNLLMLGVGSLIGLRAGVSLLLGAVLAYGVLAPFALARGWATPGAPDAAWFAPLNRWLLWPGVAMMVTASLTSFAFSWRSLAAAFRRSPPGAGPAADTGDVSRRTFLAGLAAALVLSVALQVTLFDVAAPIAAFGVVTSFLIAVVAARVSGETNVTPVGAMGKITQLIFGALAPGQVAPNLMAANVTGGAASQCADLMHDLKTGWLIGATARYQALSQVLGAAGGALVGSAAYLVLVPDPKTQLLTEEWPAPAVATWKAVAEIFAKGLGAMPAGALPAIAIAGAAGVALAIAERVVPRGRSLLPSASALGLAFVVPAYNSISMFVGAVLAALATRAAPGWSGRFLVVVAAGLIAGESLAGVGIAIRSIAR